MARFLSAEWIEEMNAAAGSAHADPAADLTVQQIVRGRDGDRRYHIRIRDGRVTVACGMDPGAQVTVAEDHDTAVAVASGELTTQEALVGGRMRVSGDVRALIAAVGILSELGDVFDAVRLRTTY